MASTIKVTNIDTPDGTGSITIDRPTVLQAGDIVTADIADVNVTTAKIADNAITLAKMAGGTDGQVITYDASGDPVAVGPGTDGQVLTSTGAGSPPAFEAVAAGFTLGTEQSTTSGDSSTGKIFGSIPSGTKLIIISFNGVSLDGTDSISVRIGDAGGIETSGYVASSARLDDDDSILWINRTTGFPLKLSFASAIVNTQMILTLIDSTNHDWVESHTGASASNEGHSGGGTKSLSAALTQLQILPINGNMDAGSINILYQ